MKNIPTIETARLILRPLSISDGDRIRKLASNNLIYKTTLNVPKKYNKGMAEKWIATHLTQYLNEEGVVFGIVHKKENVLIGVIGLGITKAHSRAEIGYWIGVNYWGQKFCTEAAKEIVKYGFEELKLHKITGNHFETNPASGKVMQNIGMKKVGTFEDHFCKDGIFITDISYEVLNPKSVYEIAIQLKKKKSKSI